jgi:hypothetical protein
VLILYFQGTDLGKMERGETPRKGLETNPFPAISEEEHQDENDPARRAPRLAVDQGRDVRKGEAPHTGMARLRITSEQMRMNCF